MNTRFPGFLVNSGPYIRQSTVLIKLVEALLVLSISGQVGTAFERRLPLIISS
jgi:hypothetical protein